MSWIETITTGKIIIQFGNGETMEVDYKRPAIEHNFNAVAIEYFNIDGAEIQRGKEAHRAFPVEFYIQGADYLETTRLFFEYAKDTRSWIMSHPYFPEEDINCQPVRLKEDYTSANVTVITGVLWESIAKTNANYAVNPKTGALESINSAAIEAIRLADKFNASTSDAAFMSLNAAGSSATAKKGAFSDIDLGSINSDIAKLNATLNTIGTEPQRFMTQAAKVFRAPATFYSTIRRRVDVLKESFTDLTNSMRGAATLSERMYYESAGALLTLAVGEASITNQNEIAIQQGIRNPDTGEFVVTDDELITRTQVLDQVIEVNQVYQDYLSQLMLMHSEKDNKLDSYYPSADLFRATQDAMNKITANLYSIAARAKIERTYIVPEDTTVLELTNKLLGTYNSDEVRNFVESNSLVMNELILVPQGREVIYYL